MVFLNIYGLHGRNYSAYWDQKYEQNSHILKKNDNFMTWEQVKNSILILSEYLRKKLYCWEPSDCYKNISHPNFPVCVLLMMSKTGFRVWILLTRYCSQICCTGLTLQITVSIILQDTWPHPPHLCLDSWWPRALWASEDNGDRLDNISDQGLIPSRKYALC